MTRAHWLYATVSAWLLTIAGPVCAQRNSPIDVSKEDLHKLTFSTLKFDTDDSNVENLSDKSFRIGMLEVLRARGYPAVGSDSVVFDDNSAQEARFVLGGHVPSVRCAAVRGGANCQLDFQWELLDRELNQVVYKVQTVSPVVEFRKDPDWEKLGLEIIGGALGSLLSRPAFVDALRKDPNADPAAYPAAGIRACKAVPGVLPAQSELALNATVVVETKEGGGSGVVLSPDGLILTAAHVVTEREAKVRTHGGSLLVAEVLRRDRTHDVALLKVQSAGELACAPLAVTKPTMGEPVYVVGAPASTELSFSMSSGIVSGLREWQGARFLQTDAAVNPGNSGGPVFNQKGELLAVVSWKLMGLDVEGVAFGVPATHALDRLRLSMGEQTDDKALRSVAVASSEKRKAFEDTPDEHAVLDPEGDRRRAIADAMPAWVPITRWSGLIGMIAGVPMVVAPWLTYTSGESTEAEYRSKRALNTAGWAVTGVGAALFTASIVFRPSDKELAKKAGVALSFSPTGLSVHRQF